MTRPHLLTVAGAAAEWSSFEDAPLSRLTAFGETARSTCYGAHSSVLHGGMHQKSGPKIIQTTLRIGA
jgi:hypothetical protein